MSGKDIKIGVHQGQSAPPFLWTVKILNMAYREAENLLKPSEYQHMAMQVKELAREETPSHSQSCSVDAIEEFFELRDTGGPLGGKNARVFFGLNTEEGFREIVILGVILKQNNGPTPQGSKITMRRRWRKFRAGEYTQ